MKHPEIVVTLVGEDGNAFNVLGIIAKALRNGGVAKPEIDRFMVEAMSSDYDNLLRVCNDWVDVR